MSDVFSCRHHRSIANRYFLTTKQSTVNCLLLGEETIVFVETGYQGADKRLDAKPCVRWHGAMRPGRRKKLDKANNPIDALIDKVEKRKGASAPRWSPRFAWSSLSI